MGREQKEKKINKWLYKVLERSKMLEWRTKHPHSTCLQSKFVIPWALHGCLKMYWSNEKFCRVPATVLTLSAKHKILIKVENGFNSLWIKRVRWTSSKLAQHNNLTSKMSLIFSMCMFSCFFAACVRGLEGWVKEKTMQNVCVQTDNRLRKGHSLFV